MPTVLDFLRRYFIGNEAADKLQLSLAILTARAVGRLQPEIQAQINLSCADDDIAELTKPSAGYEPFLMKMSLDQSAARGIANFVTRRAKQHAKDSKLDNRVLRDIRFLAKGPRQRPALVRCAQRLHDGWKATPIVGDILSQAGVDEFKFMGLLELVAKGQEVDVRRLTEIAARAVPRLSTRRGPKIGAASAAHEFFLNDKLGITRKPWPKNHENRPAEYVDALTVATRREFKNPDFDPRPAQRRSKGLNSQAK
jgi:hypothetical protein